MSLPHTMTVVNDLTFVTGNAAKAEQLRWHLPIPLHHQAVDLPEIQSLSLEEVVGHKAREAYKVIGSPVLVEDTALSFEALKGLPGPLIKWFLQELGNDGLCRLLRRLRATGGTRAGSLRMVRRARAALLLRGGLRRYRSRAQGRIRFRLG